MGISELTALELGKEIKENESPSGRRYRHLWNGFINMKIQFMLM